jgi:hypothetical protein
MFYDAEDNLVFDIKNFNSFLDLIQREAGNNKEIFDYKKWDPSKKLKSIIRPGFIYKLHASLKSLNYSDRVPSLNGYWYFKHPHAAHSMVYRGNGYLSRADLHYIVFDPEFLKHRELWILPDPIVRELALNFEVFHPPPRWKKF